MEANATMIGKRVLAFFYTTMRKEDLKKSSIVDFPDAKPAFTGAIPGLYIVNDFITEQESKELMTALDSQKWNKLLNRRVQHYGFEFKYGTNNVNAEEQMGQMPPFFDFLGPKLEQQLSNFKLDPETGFVAEYSSNDEADDRPTALSEYGLFDQCTVNDYMPGQGIPPHVDTHSPFQEVFAALSLKSGATMHFKDSENRVIDLYMQPNSLMIFSGEARYAWLHSIALRKVDKVDGLLRFRHRRVSLTFRKVKRTPCICKWPQLCDSQNKSQAVSERDIVQGEGAHAEVAGSVGATAATDMEKQHVYEVYDKIAPHFSNTRYKPWPQIAAHLNSLPDGAIVADVGCGNGKYLGVNPNLHMIGTDRSFNLVSCARERDQKFQTFVADSLQLPLRSESFDAVISIAVVHHFSSTSLRVQALSEMHRILRVGGSMLVYVWAYEQEHRKFAAQDVFVPWHLHDTYEEEKKQDERKEAHPEDSNFIETAIQDKEKKATVYHRYYHVFVENELEQLIQEHFEGKLAIEDRFYDHANWAVQLRKIA